MSNEWTELKTLQEVAAAQARGDEIEYYSTICDEWLVWDGFMWSNDMAFRSRPRKQTKTVLILAWFDGLQLLWFAQSHVPSIGRRVPSEDKTIEVEL